MKNLSNLCFLIFFVLAISQEVSSQNVCPDGWDLYEDNCYYFSRAALGLNLVQTWVGAESFCQTYGAHLVVFKTAVERDWAYSKIQLFQPSDWWIGLTDSNSERTFKWIDDTPLTDDVAKWKPGEPSNTNGEDCVEMWVDLPLYRGQWNDKSCDAKDNFICKRPPGTVQSCESGWVSFGGSCYYTFNSELQWFEGQAACKAAGADMVAITSPEEQNFVQTMVAPYTTEIWIGLTDGNTPGTLQWSSGEQTSSYNNMAAGQSLSPTTYYGSTCAGLSPNLLYKWSQYKCSDEKKFVCEKGFANTCPTSWTYLAGKCYELVVNPNRAATWTTAMETCRALGGGLLKIETDDQQKYLATALEQYYNSGAHEIWLGGSDIGHDDTFTWWDKTPITLDYWDLNMPKTVEGRFDCMTMYSGSGNKNWETSSCFYERQYICELPEGSKLPSIPVATVDGKCLDGWRWLKDFCYFFGAAEKPQSDAESFCIAQSLPSNPSMLSSITDVDEMSFIHGHISQSTWIGLKQVGGAYAWNDGEALTIENWDTSAQKTQQCVYMKHTSGTWQDSACNQVRKFVCKMPEIKLDDPYTPTPPSFDGDYEKCGGHGWFSNPSSDRCYKIDVDRTRSWNDARFKCQQEGGDLASMGTPDENAFLAAVAQGLPFAANLWIGASDKMAFQDDVIDVVDGGWTWSDGSPFVYVNWNSGEPNNAGEEDCVEILLQNGMWNDVNCAAFRHFACEKIGNNDNIIGVDYTQSVCNSNEACCFKHLGVEKGGIMPDSSLSASSIRNQNYNVTRGRLNTQETILITDIGDTRIGYHGGWMSDGSDQANSWFQVDFAVHTEFKGIITQGRNGYEMKDERQWVKTFKISYSQDPDNVKEDVQNWEFISDSNGPVVFQGNRDSDTQVTNLFPAPIVARHIRCHPLTYFDKVSMRLEYIGCRANCLLDLGMKSGYIPDIRLTALSGTPTQARPPVDPEQCRATSSDNGANYRGWLSKTVGGISCQPWAAQTPHSHNFTPQNYPDAGLIGDFCRNPDGEPEPWCYTLDPNVRWDFCAVPVCPGYTTTGWTPSSTTSTQWIQVQFEGYYKVSGITMYSLSSSYVKTYKVSFSDNGASFQFYQNQLGGDHIFYGLNGPNSQYSDILREPLTTKFLRIYAVSWQGGIKFQFEVNGCYADRVITCADKASMFEDDTVSLVCPGGCVEDFSKGAVYGTDVYTESSAVCPAAIHAGKLTNRHGGTVQLTKTGGRDTYQGTTRHGITSLPYTTAKQSVIFNGNAFRCPDGWIGWNEHCYYFSPDGLDKSWTEARAACRQLGSDLVSIWNKAENDFVLTVIVQSFNGRVVWIGLNALDVLNYYQWSDGSPAPWTYWFIKEPNSHGEKCVNMYRTNGYWNDRICEEKNPYMCKMEKQHLPPLTTIVPPTDSGCELGWTASGYSCYWTSTDTSPYYYAKQLCTEMDAHLVTIHDHYEQAFVHAYVTSTLPPSIGYTSWIGLAAKNDEKGAQIYEWVSNEEVTYTLWDEFEPDIDVKCAFPFIYQGQTYYECTTAPNPIALAPAPWCSLTPVFAGGLMYCGTGNEQECGYMDDRTGYWRTGLCTTLRYYTCEKPRIGFTQPVVTTISPRFQCTDGWVGSNMTVDCYQINEFSELSKRATWQQAYDHCTSQKADLVSVHSSIEELEIAKFVQQYGVQSYTSFWTGLNSISNSAGYSWTDGSAVSYTNWYPGEPSDHNGKENCVESMMLEYSQWNDLNCDALRNWICKIGKNRRPDPPPTLPPLQGTEDGGCGEGWIKYTTNYGAEKCYLFVAGRYNSWTRAETDCKSNGGHLVAIHDQDENTMILSRAAQTNAGSLWIGLRDIGGRSFYWADGTFLDYINWGPGEPNNYFNSEDCADISANNGLWNDDNCGLQKAYVCEKCTDCGMVEIPPTEAPEGGCPEYFALYGNKCYYVSNDMELDFNNASSYCQEMGAELAVINNEYEQAFLTSYWYGKSDSAWIGLFHRNTGSFVWVDQSPITYTAWDNGQPDNWNNEEGCTEMWLGELSSGRWNDINCDQSRSFTCYVRRSTEYLNQLPPANDLQCPEGYYGWGRGCYLLVTEGKSFSDASSHCQNLGNNLVSIGHVYENELLHSWFWKNSLLPEGSKLWTGMQYSVTANPDETSNTSFYWTNEWPVEYTNWDQGQPNIMQSDGTGCVYMSSSGAWSSTAGTGSTTCDTALPFVCKIPLDPIPTVPPIREGYCDPNYKEFNSFCYYFNAGITSETSRSWFEAREVCRQHGGDLASFHSDEELGFFIQSIQGAQSHNLYIGLYSNGYDGWVWSDGTGAEYFNWNEYEPNGQGNGHEECVEMYPWNGAWNDVSCYEDRGYVCKKPAGYTRCNVPSLLRIECGTPGITESYCVTHRGCCFDPLSVNANFSGCYWAENEFPSGFPFQTDPIPSTGLSGGAIAGIVIGVLLAVALVLAIGYYYMSGSGKSAPSFSVPSFKSKSSPEAAGGFDNPMASESYDSEA